MEKNVKKYSKVYQNALEANKFADVGTRVESFENRLQQMYT